MSQADNIVRWGVLGTARIAAKVGMGIREADGAELTAVASRSAEAAEQWAAEHGAKRSYGSYEALLEDPELDAVYIPLPPFLHREWTIKAAEHGKHVLCEKPLAVNATDAAEMAAACREHDVQLMDGVMWLHHPRADDMRAPLRDGTLGELRHLTAAFTFNWDVVPEDDFRLDRDAGGGSLLDLGWYCVGAALWAFDDVPERVYGTARFYRDVDMHFTGLLWFSGGRMATVSCGFDTVRRRWFEVAGTQASLICDDFARPWDLHKARFWLHGDAGKMEERQSAAAVQEACMIEDFGAIVRSGALEPHWPEIAVATQRVTDALDRSARTGEAVEL